MGTPRFIREFQEYVCLTTDTYTGITQDGAIINFLDRDDLAEDKRKIYYNGTWYNYKNPVFVASTPTVQVSGTVTTQLTGSIAGEDEQITVDNSAAVGLTEAKITGRTKARITVESASIRVRFTGTAPTSTEGHLYNAGDTIFLDSAEDLANFKAIASSASSATLFCTYSV